MQYKQNLNDPLKPSMRNAFPPQRQFISGCLTWIALLLSLDNWQTPGNAAVQDAEIKTGVMSIKIVDEEGEAIAGAILKPTMIVTPVGAGEWRSPPRQTRQAFESDEDGMVRLPYLNGPDPANLVIKIAIVVKHPGFAAVEVMSDVTDETLVVPLRCSLKVVAIPIDAHTKEEIKEQVFAHVQGSPLSHWKLVSNGKLASPFFKDFQKSFRLVEIVDGRARRFSDLVEVDPTQQATKLLKIPLEKALSVKGMLGPEVPRPVNNGLVSIAAVSILDSQKAVWHDAWTWNTFAKIESDGSFAVEGIPHNCIVQIFACAPGWTNQSATADQVAKRFPAYRAAFAADRHFFPTLIDINDQAVEIELPMQRTVSCRIKVVDLTTSKPIVDANVIHLSDSIVLRARAAPDLGVGSSTAARIANSRKSRSLFEQSETIERVTFLDYRGRTNADGIVEFHNFPAGGFRGTVTHPDYDIPLRQRQFSVQLSAEAPNEFEVKLAKPDE